MDRNAEKNPTVSEKIERTEIKVELLNEIIASYDRLLELMQTGGMAPLTGHAYDPKENDREIKLLEQLKASIVEMRQIEAQSLGEMKISNGRI